ncbi:Major Facilitator Superfamily protein [Promicromonospora thailandica]|uniref:Major Facilitator Superfamily protein n=2 Tax=Promicromonospora thailandica TaxID=765201 RepID=A0A9X2JXV7_9MICO|nr:Major Facilitator Superfamily protein [Promicromonospora thailandica]
MRFRFPPADRSRLTRMPSPNLVIAVLAFAGMGASFMQTILLPIQSELPVLLGTSRDVTAWVITVTLLVAAICTPISGRLGDMYGKKTVALALLGLLALGSVVAALSPSVVLLIVGRGLQGMGMGVVPLGISILRDVLHRDRLGSGIALVSATLGVGGALGLPISAFVTERYDWHVVFWVAAGIGLLALALVAWVVPVSTLRTGGRLDVVGVTGLAVGLTGVLLAVSRGNDWGWGSPRTLGLLLGGAAVLLVWGWYELRVPEPLVDLRVTARGTVLFTNLASIAMGFALFASNVVFPQLLELPTAAGGLGLSLMQASLVLMPSGLVMLAMSPVAGRLEHRIGPKPLLAAGAAVIAVSYVIAVVVDLDVWSVLVVNVVVGVGIGLGFAAMPALIMRVVPAHETGAANGLNTLMRSLGTTSAAAVVGGVLAAGGAELDGVPVPSDDAFRTALLLGLLASVVCTVLALLIPRPTPPAHEHTSLPDGVL